MPARHPAAAPFELHIAASKAVEVDDDEEHEEKEGEELGNFMFEIELISSKGK